MQEQVLRYVYNYGNFTGAYAAKSKSFVMLVGSQQAIQTNTSDFAFYLNNEMLEEVKSARYVGLEIDSLLKCNVHVKKSYLELFQ